MENQKDRFTLFWPPKLNLSYPMKLILQHDIRDLLLRWEKQNCPQCKAELTFEELCEGVPIEIYCEECHIVFDEPVIISLG